MPLHRANDSYLTIKMVEVGIMDQRSSNINGAPPSFEESLRRNFEPDEARQRVMHWEIVEDRRVDLHLISLSANEGVTRFEVLFSAEKRSDAWRIMEQIASDNSAVSPTERTQAAE
jgi:hypothetical protein